MMMAALHHACHHEFTVVGIAHSRQLLDESDRGPDLVVMRTNTIIEAFRR